MSVFLMYFFFLMFYVNSSVLNAEFRNTLVCEWQINQSIDRAIIIMFVVKLSLIMMRRAITVWVKQTYLLLYMFWLSNYDGVCILCMYHYLHMLVSYWCQNYHLCALSSLQSDIMYKKCFAWIRQLKIINRLYIVFQL